MTVDWKHWTVGDAITLALLLVSILIGAWHLSQRFNELAESNKAMIRLLRENGKKLDGVAATQKRVVDIMHDFPPHRHVGNQIIYPNTLPDAPQVRPDESDRSDEPGDPNSPKR
jgi:hypothetical protein